MKRLPSPQQLTWFLDLQSTGQIDLDPHTKEKASGLQKIESSF